MRGDFAFHPRGDWWFLLVQRPVNHRHGGGGVSDGLVGHATSFNDLLFRLADHFVRGDAVFCRSKLINKPRGL